MRTAGCTDRDVRQCPLRLAGTTLSCPGTTTPSIRRQPSAGAAAERSAPGTRGPTEIISPMELAAPAIQAASPPLDPEQIAHPLPSHAAPPTGCPRSARRAAARARWRTGSRPPKPPATPGWRLLHCRSAVPMFRPTRRSTPAPRRPLSLPQRTLKSQGAIDRCRLIAVLASYRLCQPRCCVLTAPPPPQTSCLGSAWTLKVTWISNLLATILHCCIL